MRILSSLLLIICLFECGTSLNINNYKLNSSYKITCLKGETWGRNANQMTSIFHAISHYEILGLDKHWSTFYVRWFEPHPRIKLYFQDECKNFITPKDAFYLPKEPGIKFFELRRIDLKLKKRLLKRALDCPSKIFS